MKTGADQGCGQVEGVYSFYSGCYGKNAQNGAKVEFAVLSLNFGLCNMCKGGVL